MSEDGSTRGWPLLTPEDRRDMAALHDYWAFQRQVRRVAGIGRGNVVHHLDGDPYNSDPANLVIVDPKENDR